MEMAELKKLAIAIILCELAGIIGSFFTFSAIQDWYAYLDKPWFTPPGWLFGPVWTFLYLLMGISAYLVWKKGIEKKEVKLALALFGLQLVFNCAWSIIFFGLRDAYFAFVEIILLWILIALTISKFYLIDKKSAYLMLPYLAWVSFAAVLNFSVWLLNG